MSEAANDIADLDDELARSGQDVTLRRIVPNAAAIERPHRAFVRGYRADELIGGIQHGDSLVVMSPTDLPAEFAEDNPQTRLKRNDRILFDGRSPNVEVVDRVRVAGVLVRLNVTVRG